MSDTISEMFEYKGTGFSHVNVCVVLYTFTEHAWNTTILLFNHWASTLRCAGAACGSKELGPKLS